MRPLRFASTGIRGVVMSVVVVCAFCEAAFGQYGGGSGTAEEPYLIYTAAQMNSIGADANYWDAHFELMADIDLSGYTGVSFNIIGDSNTSFTGVFDGNGHTISNFTYSSSGTDYTGLFGHVDGPGAEIKDLGLVNPDVDAGNGERVGALAGQTGEGSITNCYAEGGSVSGGDFAGGLVGRCGSTVVLDCHSTCSVSGDAHVGGLVGYGGTIRNCYSTGSVSGNFTVGGLVGVGGTILDSYSGGSVSASGAYIRWVGGLVGTGGTISNCYSKASVLSSGSDVFGTGGLAGGGGHISNCYATSSVSGVNGVGGLVGSGGTIHNCYSRGSVSGTTNVGGLVGSEGIVSASFWDIQTSGQLSSAGGTGKTTVQMQDINIFLAAGWDFVNQADGPSDDWAEPEAQGYMILWWQLGEHELPALPTFSGGTGEANDPYLIATVSDLNGIGHNPRLMERHFKLINNIDLAGVDFFFIGNRGYGYSGIFNGNGHTISNFTYSQPGTNNIGLFGGIAGKDAEVKDLGLIDPNIDVGAGSHIGSVVGWLTDGTVSDCYVENGRVSGSALVGGLVGASERGTISNCHSSGIVSGGANGAGGLVGSSEYGTITNCYSSCEVSGTIDVGGLVGYRGTVTNCYALGDVSGDWTVGGLVGNGGTVTNCYTLGDVSGGWYVGGLVGVGGSISNCYSTGSVSGVNDVGGLVGINYGTVSSSFWDTQTSGRSNMCGSQESGASGCDEGNGKTTVEMQMASTFIEAGWDFVGEVINGANDIWYCDEPNYPQLAWEVALSANIDMDEMWMYQSLPGQSNSDLTAGVSVTDDPMGNSSYSYEWEIVLAGDVSLAPVTAAGGGTSDAYLTFAALGCDEPDGLSDSGQTFTVRVTITGDDYGNTGQAEAEFGIALLGDTNNDGVVNVADRSITNAFWRTGSAGPYTLRDCDVNCDGVVNVADRSIANAIWRGILGQNSVSSPCPLR